MLKVIDCENQESAVNSLCGLFRCSSDDLCDQLLQIDIDRTYEQDEPDCPPDEFLYRRLVLAFGQPDEPQGIYWFHLTRTSPQNRFHEGILPLGMALDSIWEMVLSIFKFSQHFSRLQSMRMHGVSNYHYQLKTPDPFHWGPFAMLVRDVAFDAKRIGNHDYLWLPEIIEDICNDYLDKYGVSIHEDVVNALVPCIIKFVARDNNDTGCVGPAINYVYSCIRGEPVSHYANTCFDAGGRVIPPGDILKIEYLENP